MNESEWADPCMLFNLACLLCNIKKAANRLGTWEGVVLMISSSRLHHSLPSRCKHVYILMSMPIL